MLGVTYWLWLLFLYVQNGFFEGAIVVYFLVTCFALLFANFIEIFFLKPIYAVIHCRITRLTNLIVISKILNSIAVGIPCIFLLINARKSSAVFNYYLAIMLTMQASFLIIEWAIMIFQAR